MKTFKVPGLGSPCISKGNQGSSVIEIQGVHKVPVPLQVFIPQKPYNLRVLQFFCRMFYFSSSLHSEDFMQYIPHYSMSYGFRAINTCNGTGITGTL